MHDLRVFIEQLERTQSVISIEDAVADYRFHASASLPALGPAKGVGSQSCQLTLLNVSYRIAWHTGP